MKHIKLAILLSLAVIIMVLASSCVISQEEKQEQISQSNAQQEELIKASEEEKQAQISQSKAHEEELVKEKIIDILQSTKVNENWAPTIGEMIVKVFYNYKIEYELFDNSTTEYIVEISGDYSPNPDVPNLSYNGTMSYLIDLSDNSCVLKSDPNNIKATFVVFIVNGY